MPPFVLLLLTPRMLGAGLHSTPCHPLTHWVTSAPFLQEMCMSPWASDTPGALSSGLKHYRGVSAHRLYPALRPYLLLS